jgi:Fe-Mn family superoxide dismutase
MFALPELPYAYDALEPTMSARTLKCHHDKHHAAYVKKVNELVQQSGNAAANLEAVIKGAAGSNEKLYNNAAQAWNHAFFWISMKPGANSPAGDLPAAIAAAFGGQAKLADAFVTAGAEHFGSGWVWLTADPAGKLMIKTTHDAHDTVTEPNETPLLVCDLWEHAYYLDYQFDRKAFLKAWFEALPNWSFAAAQLAAAKGDGRAWRYPAPDAHARAA